MNCSVSTLALATLTFFRSPRRCANSLTHSSSNALRDFPGVLRMAILKNCPRPLAVLLDKEFHEQIPQLFRLAWRQSKAPPFTGDKEHWELVDDLKRGHRIRAGLSKSFQYRFRLGNTEEAAHESL